MSKRIDPEASTTTPKRAKLQEKSTPSKSTSTKKQPAPIIDLEECGFDTQILPNLRSALLEWYDKNHRILPWRRNPHSQLSPEAIASAENAGQLPAPDSLPLDQFTYYVWVCEIMSQQTQVARAAEYFKNWVARWPDVNALSLATQEEVNEMWAGLGYYRRARFLLEGAKYVVGELGGAFPSSAKELQKIPGIGAYTSCAIASIALGERVAVVDGNVIRVLARMRQLDGDPRTSSMVQLFADVAAQALDPERPGDFNQAVMELGATVCVPNTHPQCSACPVKAYCKGYNAEEEYKKSGGGNAKAVSVTDYPTKVKKAEKREESVAVAVVQIIPSSYSSATGTDTSAGKFLLLKRPEGGLLAGLWEFPLISVDASSSKTEKNEAVNGLLHAHFLPFGFHMNSKNDCDDENKSLKLVERKNLGEVVHVFSHIRMTMHVEKIVLQGDCFVDDGCDTNESKNEANFQWLTAAMLEEKGLSSGVKKVFQLFKKQKSAAAQSIAKFFKPKKAD